MSAGCGRALGRACGEGEQPPREPGVAVSDRRRGGWPRGATRGLGPSGPSVQ